MVSVGVKILSILTFRGSLRLGVLVAVLVDLLIKCFLVFQSNSYSFLAPVISKMPLARSKYEAKSAFYIFVGANSMALLFH